MQDPVRRLLKVFVGVLVILLILLVGINVGRRVGYNGYGMMGGFNDDNGRTFMFKTGGMMGGAGNVWYNNNFGQRVSGTIVSVDGTKITLTDNGGKEQVVYSNSNTVISTTTGEIPLTALKAKEYVVVWAVADQSGKLQAQKIAVQ